MQVGCNCLLQRNDRRKEENLATHQDNKIGAVLSAVLEYRMAVRLFTRLQGTRLDYTTHVI